MGTILSNPTSARVELEAPFRGTPSLTYVWDWGTYTDPNGGGKLIMIVNRVHIIGVHNSRSKKYKPFFGPTSENGNAIIRLAK